MTTESIIARLKPKRDKQATNGHPWIFSGAIASWEGQPSIGAVVDVFSHDGRFIGRGLAHPKSDLAIRLYAWHRDARLDEAFWRRRIQAAVGLRSRLFTSAETNAYRVVFSESDGISGLIADRYADALAVRVGAAALAPFLPVLISSLIEATGVKDVMVSADQDAVARERLDAGGVAAHSTSSRKTVEILENGIRFAVDLADGQKTGFYLDQRENRMRVARYAAGRDVLSAYGYTGAFEVYAGRAGAKSVLGLDSSEPALARAREHVELNGITTPIEFRAANVPVALRRFRDEGRSFDLVILDPPRFVSNMAQKEKGMRAYKDINLLGLKLLTPGGFLATFSCSGLVSLEDLKMAVRWAAKDSRRTVRFIEILSQPPDHPTLTTFPEGEYLTGLIAAVE